MLDDCAKGSQGFPVLICQTLSAPVGAQLYACEAKAQDREVAAQVQGMRALLWVEGETVPVPEALWWRHAQQEGLSSLCNQHLPPA